MKAAIVAVIGLMSPIMAQDTPPAPLTVYPPGQNAESGTPAHFTGSVVGASRFQASGGSRMGGSTVTFRPGARTFWHRHPLGQLLVVTAGRGWIQAEGEPVRQVAPGDVIWTAPGVKHWHGGTSRTAMTHVAVSETVPGQAVTWLEPVSNAQYHGPK